jgi:triosephosphate isomerase
MHLGRVDQALGLVRALRGPLGRIRGADVVLCPPFTVLAALAEVLAPSPTSLGAQTMHWREDGAHTGEISPAMLVGLCEYVILGHSERRASGAESDGTVNRAVHAALSHGLTPIVCVGENLDEHQAGRTDHVVGAQVAAALADLDPPRVGRSVIAYEPVWAIGSGRAATPADANRTIELTIRGRIANAFGEDSAQRVRVLYGGSVTAANIAAFMTMPGIDGALVGGASLTAKFVELVRRGLAIMTEVRDS